MVRRIARCEPTISGGSDGNAGLLDRQKLVRGGFGVSGSSGAALQCCSAISDDDTAAQRHRKPCGCDEDEHEVVAGEQYLATAGQW